MELEKLINNVFEWFEKDFAAHRKIYKWKHTSCQKQQPRGLNLGKIVVPKFKPTPEYIKCKKVEELDLDKLNSLVEEFIGANQNNS